MTEHREPTPPNRALVAALLLLLVLAVPAAEATQQSLKQAEAQRFRAMAANDLEALKKILDDDLVYTHTNGRVDDKESFLANLESGALRYRKIELRGMDPVFWAGEAGMVTGKVILHVEAGERQLTLPVRFTSVYRLGEDRAWHLLGWQSTVIPEASPQDDEGEEAPATKGSAPAPDAGGGDAAGGERG